MSVGSREIYRYDQYKPFLLDRLTAGAGRGRGMRSKLAKAMGCQLAYVSHVLNGVRNLSVEQAEAAARFLELGADETEYFVWLVERERAGTSGARKFFNRLLEKKRIQATQVKERVNIRTELSAEDQATYYGNHLYAAVHMLVTIPEHSSVQELANRLREPVDRIRNVVEFLLSRGLLFQGRTGLQPGSRYLYVDRTSPFVQQHHANWRFQALQSVAHGSEESLHLSMVATLSAEDAGRLRQKMAEFISEVTSEIKASKEEKLMIFNLDFFEV